MRLNNWKKKVERKLESRFGLDLTECDEDQLQDAFNNQETPDEFVSRLGAKYNLVDLSEVGMY